MSRKTFGQIYESGTEVSAEKLNIFDPYISNLKKVLSEMQY